MRKVERFVDRWQEDPGNETFRKKLKRDIKILKKNVRFKVGDKVKVVGLAYQSQSRPVVSAHGMIGEVIEVCFFSQAVWYDTKLPIPGDAYYGGNWLFRGDELCRVR